MVTASCVLVAACASAESEKTPPPTPTKEIAAGGARLRGGGLRMDVQIGRALPRQPVKNATTIAKPTATVTP